jgi:hypothetical protein
MTQKLSNAARSAAADAVLALLDAGAAGGTIKVYTGSQPAGPDTAVGAQVLLATFTMDATRAYAAAANGVAAMDATPTLTATGLAAGTAAWYRMADSNGVAVIDGAVTATGGGGEMQLNTTTVSVGLALELTAGTYTQPA